MNANAKQWVAALRSGEFEQTDGALRYGDKFCCLGVACELYRRETGEGCWLPYRTEYFSFLHADSMLPLPVQAWLELSSEGGHMADGRDLFDINDSGATFSEIADLIESEPAGLFVD